MAQRTAPREDLRRFLVSCRSRVSPEDVGLPRGGPRRRTTGLRREEVAVLAGVAPSWYQWLEQGRDINVSPQVLDAVARVLAMDDAERRLLYGLAGVNPPPPAITAGVTYCEGLQRLIDAWEPKPATMLDRYWNTVARNEAARLTLGLPETGHNCLVGFFRDPAYRRREEAWERIAPSIVAAFRAAVAERPGDEGFRAVIDELTASSPEFAELWARQQVAPPGILRNEVEHPVVGTLVLESSQMQLPARPDLIVVFYTPVPETDTAAKIDWLRSGRAETAAAPVETNGGAESE